MMHMQRIYAQLEDLVYQKIEVYIQENKISRAKFLVDAIDAYLHLLESGKDANPDTLHQEIMQLRTKENESWQEITKLKSTIKDANCKGKTPSCMMKLTNLPRALQSYVKS